MEDIQPKVKTVSYSQFNIYANCPKKWKLDYLDNLRVYSQSIHTVFGTAMHVTIQNYVTILFTESVKAADSIDLGEYLKQTLFNEYKQSLAQNGNVHYSTPAELAEFYEDGVAILKYFKSHRAQYFNTKHHELVGVEVALQAPLIYNVAFVGFIDIVVKDTRDNTYAIYDIKTSTSGWNKYQKADQTKTAQLILYKEFYAKLFNVDADSIHVEYIIVRRKINPALEFAPKRIQSFVPASGKPTRNKIGKMFMDFIQTCFTETGEYNSTSTYPAIDSSGCKYCIYKSQEALCPKKERIKQ